MEEQKKVRCAIYTRKSTDEGLDKEFNTLEAQREAGANYILSQKHQGWVLLDERYDDGGFSGGNINRPALKRLIHDVEAGKIDMIVVYKIDRLTRSLADFSKLIEVLDKHKCSFVSVTQNFNTYDSMGRLTLNVLLSFAQFEREVGAERIRDKVAASRKKGMWMGGKVPFGYMLINKHLEINPTEAEIVRLIFNKYSACKSERDVCTFLKAGGYCINARKQKNGTELPAKEFTVSKIDYMLRNPIYIGKVVHKGTVYDGQQEAIISKELWERVENTRLGNRHGKLKPSRVVRNALLKGMLECGCGCNSSMIPTRTRKKNRTYEYYVSLKAVKEGYQHCELGSIPVGELDKFVLSKIQNILKSPLLLNELLKYLKPDMPEIGMNELLQKTKAPEDFFTYLSQESLRQILERLISRVIIYKDKLVNIVYAVEILLKDNTVVLGGEVSGNVDLSEVKEFVKDALRDIGYDENYAARWGKYAIDVRKVEIINLIGQQSADIKQGIEQNGWGDQGVFVGYACQGEDFISREMFLARKLNRALYQKARQSKNLGIDIKTQISFLKQMTKN